MNEDDLRAELMQAEEAMWSPAALRWIEANGFPVRQMIDTAPGIGVGRVEFSGPFWQPCEGGKPAVIAGIWINPPVDLPNDTRSLGVLVDVAAIDLADGSVALRRGVAFCLGEHLLEQDPRPFRLRAFLDARAWLMAAGDGVMPVDWPTFARRTAGEPRLNLLADSVEVGEEIERRMQATQPQMPRVMVRSDRRAA